MKKAKILLLSLVLLSIAQATTAQTTTNVSRQWQVGFGLGELPMDGSFKPSITIGHHFSTKLYAGIIYQLSDHISRNEASINAKSSGLAGLESSSEAVARRFLFQLRYTLVKHGPYLSTGFVYNGQDVEHMVFDDRVRAIGDESFEGTIEITQARPAGWGLALGLGYQYTFKNGFALGFEWTPAWFQYPEPVYEFAGTANLSTTAQELLIDRMNNEFDASVTNMYKVFHIGVAYSF